MPINYLAPAFVKLFYNRTGLLKPHVKTIPVKPSGSVTPGTEPNLLEHDSTGIAFGDGVDALVDLAKEIYSTAFTFTHAEFWSQPTKDDDPLFIFDHSIGVTGVLTGAYTKAVQTVITYRTGAGGLMRDYWMENNVAADIVAFPPFSTDYGNLSDYWLSDAGWGWGRDNAKPTSVISLKTKTNDALRRALITG